VDEQQHASIPLCRDPASDSTVAVPYQARYVFYAG
jgi:hypothetical protein